MAIHPVFLFWLSRCSSKLKMQIVILWMSIVMIILSSRGVHICLGQLKSRVNKQFMGWCCGLKSFGPHAVTSLLQLLLLKEREKRQWIQGATAVFWKKQWDKETKAVTPTILITATYKRGWLYAKSPLTWPTPPHCFLHNFFSSSPRQWKRQWQTNPPVGINTTTLLLSPPSPLGKDKIGFGPLHTGPFSPPKAMPCSSQKRKSLISVLQQWWGYRTMT